LLEKHKDYVKRAKDYHSKEDRIKKLRQKAALKNKDEFYFGMIRSRTEKGVHVQDRGNEAMPVDVVKLLKTQDAGYVRTLISTEEKLVERLRNQVGSSMVLQEEEEKTGQQIDGGQLDSDSDSDGDRGEGTSKGPSKDYVLSLLSKDGGPVQGKKTVFVDSAKQVARYQPHKVTASASASGSTTAGKPDKKGKSNKKAASAVESKGKNKGKGKAAAAAAAAAGGSEEEDKLATLEDRKEHLSSLTHELSARINRLNLLRRTFREMQVQRSLMGNGSKQVVGGKSNGLSREEERLNENDYDELELKRLNSQRRKSLPNPEIGVRTGARVWKWKAERKR